MPVPSGNSDKVNTTGGAFTATTEGGTILGNTSTGAVITKALALKDNATDDAVGTKPKVLANGLSANQKILSGGAFAYEVAGKYVIAASSTTLAGVASTKMLITGRGSVLNSINQFEHDFGADTTSLMRSNRFARSGFLNTGAKAIRRTPWLDATGANVAAPSTLTGNDLWNPVAGATASRSDSAANPTRAIPGELVMKVDFVTLDVSDANAGDFFNYKPITGM